MAPLVPIPSACPFDGLGHIITYAGQCTPCPCPGPGGRATPPCPGQGGGGGLLHGGGGGSHVHVCCAVGLRVRRAAPLCAAPHNACRGAPHRAAHYTASHALCFTALPCGLRCTLCTVPHRTVCAVPHCSMPSPTPVPRAQQHRVEGTVSLVPAPTTFTPSPLKGRWGCYTSCTQAAAHVLQPM